MIKRAKRNYIITIMMSCFMIFITVFALIGLDKAMSYGEVYGIIRSVEVRMAESGTYDDSYYYTESTVKYDYTVGKREYSGTTEIRADYTGREGEQIKVIYDKSNPLKSNIGSLFGAMLYGIGSILGTIYLLCWVIHDIIMWTRRRKEENAQINWQGLSADELLALSDEKKRKKKTNIILFIVSCLCTFIFLIFAFPLWAYSIARAIDVKLCYPSQYVKLA